VLEVVKGEGACYRGKKVRAKCDCGTEKIVEKGALRQGRNKRCMECRKREQQSEFSRVEATHAERAALHAGFGKKRPTTADEAGQLGLLHGIHGRICPAHQVPMSMSVERRVFRRKRKKDGGVTERAQERVRWTCGLCETARRLDVAGLSAKIRAGDYPAILRKNQRALLPSDVVAKYDEEMACRRGRRAEENKRRNRERRLLQKYDLSPGDVASMAEAQEGACAICHRTDRPLVVDHCHGTGLVRDLLCGNCNTGLGMFEDNQLLFLRAMLYVKRHRSAS
jgi:hypothetical protein